MDVCCAREAAGLRQNWGGGGGGGERLNSG